MTASLASMSFITQKDFKSKESSLKHKEEKLKLLKKNHAEDLQGKHLDQIEDLTKDIEMCKSQVGGQEVVGKLLVEETKYKLTWVVYMRYIYTLQPWFIYCVSVMHF